MSFTYRNREGTTYYLHTGPKRGGGLQHYLSTSDKGNLAEAIPNGFEVYETPNAQVYLRRKKPALVQPAEVACVERELAGRRPPPRYKIEVRGPHIIVHESTTDLSFMREYNPFLSLGQAEAVNEKFAHYTPVMRFGLKDAGRRLFAPERYCFRGSVDDWISIGAAEAIEKLARRYLKHLGHDSFYDIM